MDKQTLTDTIGGLFLEQLGLDLSEVVELKENKFVLKMELLAISMGSMQLDLTQEQHGLMADFIEAIQKDNPL